MQRLIKLNFAKLGISRFLQSKLNVVLVRYLPKWMARGYIFGLGRLFICCKPGMQKTIRAHLTAALERGSIVPPLKLTNKTLAGVVTHYYEKLFVAFFNFPKVCDFLRQRVRLKNDALLDAALAQGRGVILVTGHYGAVEFLPLTLALRGYPVTMLLRFKTARLKESLTRRARDVDIDLVDVDDDKRVIFTALKSLKENRILITECDEFDRWCTDKRKRVRFLGSSLGQDRSLDMLHKRSKAPVVMGLVHRQADEHYELRLHSLQEKKATRNAASIAQAALSRLEAYITAAPEQWYQWKEADFLLADAVSNPMRQEHEVLTYRPVPLADPLPHVFQT